MTDKVEVGAMELLKEIHTEVTSDPDRTDEIRWVPDKEEVAGKVLLKLTEIEPATAGELSDELGGIDVTRSLTILYRSFLIDREPVKDQHTYTLREEGEKVIADMNEQKTLENPGDPWDDTNLSRTQYMTLKAVSDLEGHPRSSEVGEEYAEQAGKSNASNPSQQASPHLSTLYESGYVDRPDVQPYVYWVTEKGEEALE